MKPNHMTDIHIMSSAAKNEFCPPAFLKNAHVQSVLASLKLRSPFVRLKAGEMIKKSVPYIIDCGNSAKLMGYFTDNKKGNKNLVILIHGWEGSANSLYILSAASFLFKRGFSVFRLNLRDHGDTHKLNRGLFHSCLIKEVTGAISRIEEKFYHKNLFLCGFSLGGNFSLRAALRAPLEGIKLKKVFAISPVLHPPKTMDALYNGFFLYHDYFVKKWKKSLVKKHKVYPDMVDIKVLYSLDTLKAMTEYFAPRHTGFPDADSYLNGYSIVGDTLKDLKVPCHILAAKDDPVIPYEDISRLYPSCYLKIELTERGGHCGFFTDVFLNSWAEQKMVEIFT